MSTNLLSIIYMEASRRDANGRRHYFLPSEAFRQNANSFDKQNIDPLFEIR